MTRHWVQYTVENTTTGEQYGPCESGMVDTRGQAEAWIAEYERDLPNNAALVDVDIYPEHDVFEADTVDEWNGVAI